MKILGCFALIVLMMPSPVRAATWSDFWKAISLAADVKTLLPEIDSYNTDWYAARELSYRSVIATNGEELTAYVQSVINETGENGILLTVFYMDYEQDGNVVKGFTGIFASGVGSDPLDASFKSKISEPKLFHSFPNFLEAKNVLGDPLHPFPSEETFGIWLELDASGKLQHEIVRDIDRVNKQADIRWMLLKQRLYHESNRDFFVDMANEAQVYSDHLETLRNRKVNAETARDLRALAAEVAYANRLLASAVANRDQALARARKYKVWGDVAAILGATASVVQNYESMTANSEAQSNYHTTEINNISINYTEIKLELNSFLNQNYNISTGALPGTEVDIPMP